MKRILTILLTALLFEACDPISPEARVKEAAKLEDRQQFKEAVVLLDKAIAKDPDYLPAYINRGADKAAMGNYKAAIKDYSTVIDKDPKNALAFLNRGRNEHRLKDYKSAIEDYNEALETTGDGPLRIELDPAFATGYECKPEEIRLERGVSLYFFGNLKDSWNDLQYCLRINYEPTEALYWRALIYMSTGDTVQGCKDFQQVSQLGNVNAEKEMKRFCQ